jgi:hypothetical protein
MSRAFHRLDAQLRAPIPVITPDGRMIDIAPNQVVDDIDAFLRKESAAAIRKN